MKLLTAIYFAFLKQKTAKIKEIDSRVILEEGETIPVSNSAVVVSSSATGSAVDETHIISNKKGTKQYLVKTESKKEYKEINKSYKEEIVEG